MNPTKYQVAVVIAITAISLLSCKKENFAQFPKGKEVATAYSKITVRGGTNSLTSLKIITG